MTDDSSTLAAQALPFLVKLGLAKQCEHCPSTRATVGRLNARPTKVTLMADRAYPQGSENTLDDVPLGGRVRVHCGHCHDTMIEPTDNGWRLLGFVKRFLAEASGEDLDRVTEIPF